MAQSLGISEPEKETPMKIEDSVALVTGSNRGIGRALVAALVEAGARRVYAAARNPASLASLVDAGAGRVVPVTLDVTSKSDVSELPAVCKDVNLLINNAGSLSAYGLLESAEADLAREFATNFYGPLAVTKAMLPTLERAAPAAIVNLLTVVSVASMPALGGYSATKAAAFSMTQALRYELAKKQIAVHAVFPGPVDTDMAKSITLPKTSPDDVARAIVEAVARGEEDILPDPMSRQVVGAWLKDPKAVERQFGAM